MKINTKYVGEVHIDETKIIHFESGLPGFKEETHFTLLDLPGELSSTFQTLQSIKTENLAFIVTSPYHFYQDYEFRLDEQLVEHLAIKSEKDVAVITIVTLKSPFEKSTVNLKAPVIINFNKKCGKQYILNNEKYKAQTPLPKGDI